MNKFFLLAAVALLGVSSAKADSALVCKNFPFEPVSTMITRHTANPNYTALDIEAEQGLKLWDARILLSDLTGKAEDVGYKVTNVSTVFQKGECPISEDYKTQVATCQALQAVVITATQTGADGKVSTKKLTINAKVDVTVAILSNATTFFEIVNGTITIQDGRVLKIVVGGDCETVG